MAKELSKEQKEKKHKAFLAQKEYFSKLNNLLGCERNQIAPEANLVIMRREVDEAKKRLNIAEADAAY